jgi:hypothetical protein
MFVLETSVYDNNSKFKKYKLNIMLGFILWIWQSHLYKLKHT